MPSEDPNWKPRWVEDDDTVWFEVTPGETLEPWEALPGTVEEQNRLGTTFDLAYDDFVRCVKESGLYLHAKELAEDIIQRALLGWDEGLSQRLVSLVNYLASGVEDESDFP